MFISMKLVFQNVKYDAIFLMRKAGYGYERQDPQTKECAFSRRLAAYQYPRFHVYAHNEGSALIVNLHLDQKKPSYTGASAHSGEYDGEIIEAEVERIKTLMERIIHNNA